MKYNFTSYLRSILEISEKYLLETFSKDRYQEFLKNIELIDKLSDRNAIIRSFSKSYIKFVKEDYQRQYTDIDKELNKFINQKDDGIKIVWGNCFSVLKKLKPESIQLMVTSPPYYNS